jgi:hypothetical protein
MRVDVGAHLDLLDLDDLLLLAGFALLLLFLEFELPVIENLADRRVGVGRDLHEIQPGLGGMLESFFDGDNALHFAFRIDKADGTDGDQFIDTGAFTDRRSRMTWWSGYRNLLSFFP